jgi:hypothetical protein
MPETVRPKGVGAQVYTTRSRLTQYDDQQKFSLQLNLNRKFFVRIRIEQNSAKSFLCIEFLLDQRFATDGQKHRTLRPKSYNHRNRKNLVISLRHRKRTPTAALPLSIHAAPELKSCHNCGRLVFLENRMNPQSHQTHHTLDATLASKFARLALGHLTREYPNKLDHVMGSAADAQGPRALHPIF